MNTKILLTGPAGSGKTHALLDDFERTLREPTDPLTRDCYFLLPSAEHTERIMQMLLLRGLKGFFHRRITTFSRLASEIFEGSLDPLATNVTRFLILREIAVSGGGYFDEVKASAGFLNLLQSFITELKESLISPETFRARMNLLKTLEPDLSAKYEALAGYYEAYAAALAGRGLHDMQDAWSVYQERKARGAVRVPRLRKIWIDGFFDFSPLQLAYLKELCGMAEEVTVTLTLDPDPKRQELFEMVHGTAAALQALGFERREVPRRAASWEGSLGSLEARLFSPPGREARLKEQGEVRVFEAVGMEGEMEMIARTVEKLHRTEGYRFSDFAILLRETGGYDSVIRSVFARYDIPVELHERERLKFAPAMRAVVQLLKIFREGWKAQDLFGLLKSSYLKKLGDQPSDPEWAGELEHRAFAAGIFAGRERWLEPWDRDGSLAAFDAAKSVRLGVLTSLEDQMRQAGNYQELRRIFVRALTRTLAIFSGLEGAGEPVRRDAASWRRLEILLEEIELSLPAQPAEGESLMDTFCDRFFRLVDLDLYSLHDQDRNRVQVYTVSLARQKDYRVVFLAGLLERRFPRQIREDPLLSDWERRLFNGPDPVPLLRERLASQSLERYLFYVAVTRAREKLYLTYPRLDLEGRESLPSYYVEEVRSRFENGLPPEKQPLGRPYPAPGEAVTLRELEMAVIGELWRPSRDSKKQEGLLLACANTLLAGASSREHFRKAFFEIHDSLDDDALLLRDPFRSKKTSATRLEEYGKCPFKYYARYVLGLEDPEEDKNAMARGKILHEVLEHCFAVWKEKPGMLRSRSKAMTLVQEEFETAWKKYPLVIDKRYRYDLEKDGLWEMLERFLQSEWTRLETSPLKPAYFEHGFGDGEKLPPLEIEDEGRVIRVRGKIDRVDLDGEGRRALVLDYKTRASFDAGSLELGTALQLPLYSYVLEKLMGLEVAGAELYSVAKREKKGFYREAFLELFPGLSSRRMILEEKAFHSLVDRALEFTRRFSREMEALKMPVRPRECSDHCPFPAVCRIQKWKLPMILDEIRAEDSLKREAEGKVKA